MKSIRRELKKKIRDFGGKKFVTREQVVSFNVRFVAPIVFFHDKESILKELFIRLQVHMRHTKNLNNSHKYIDIVHSKMIVQA